MNPVEQYIQTNDNAGDYADFLLEELEQYALEDIDDLFNNTANRDGEFWQELGVDPELTTKDYDDVDDSGRDLNWSLGLAGISAAATTQYFLDNREETIIKPVAYREQVLAGFTLTRVQLVQAGKRAGEIISEARFLAIQARYLDDLSYLRNLDDVQLFGTLLDYGAIQAPDKIIADSMGYVSRMTSYRPGSIQFKEAVSDLIDTNSRRALKGMNRQAIQSIYTYREVDGDMDRELVWIGEGGKNTCEYCFDNFGVVKTYRRWLEDGLPGMDTCKGGSLCRCILSAI